MREAGFVPLETLDQVSCLVLTLTLTQTLETLDQESSPC